MIIESDLFDYPSFIQQTGRLLDPLDSQTKPKCWNVSVRSLKPAEESPTMTRRERTAQRDVNDVQRLSTEDPVTNLR